MSKKVLYLVCNAHIDPVWLWRWPEGVAETLSTFRTAARFCREYDEFVFCHNESLLYRYVEQYEPELFQQIKELVQEGRWHLMGGWYLQPDCNLPSGESLVRQILTGKSYFREKFGQEPHTAFNPDAFGHSRGLVQILKKSGYTSYLFCRPGPKEYRLTANDFVWVGYDGSELLAHRADEHYNSRQAEAGDKLEAWQRENSQRESGLFLWGIGDHGGGPSRQDLDRLRQMIKEDTGWQIRHGIPEAYFDSLMAAKERLPRHEEDLNPWAVGCYTSMTTVKQMHRRLENQYFLTEKMAAQAALTGLLAYPQTELREALEDLLFCEFHDILAGTSTAEVEQDVLARLGHGLEIVSRLRNRAFFALLSGQAPANGGEFPIFVYNPHPFAVRQMVTCEFQPPEPNFNPAVSWLPLVGGEAGGVIAHQSEKESCNIEVDQRKRVVFEAVLQPSQMNRFNCRLQEINSEGRPQLVQEEERTLCFHSHDCEAEIDRESGLLKRYRVKGFDFLQPGAMRLLVMRDNADPWGMKVRAFREPGGEFCLMSPEESAAFAGVDASRLAPVRLIEDGAVRTVVEALFKYRRSTVCLHYKVPRRGSEIEVALRVYWNEQDRMLKLVLPTALQQGVCRGQVAYGVETYTREAEELLAQKWLALVSARQEKAFTVINDAAYGFDYRAGELRLSLLRSPAYAGHPVEGKPHIVRQDRFVPRIDQGERLFRFWINGGDQEERLRRVDREALVKNEAPPVLAVNPPGTGQKPLPGIRLGDEAVQVTAVKMSADQKKLIIRLFEPTGQARRTRLLIPCLDLAIDVHLQAFEIKTLAIEPTSGKWYEVDLLERTPHES